jgi:hypothetical protein
VEYSGYAKNRSTEVKIKHPVEPNLFRLLTVTEHAKCKSIPLYLIKKVQSATLGHHILGNAVLHAPFVSVGELMGKHIRSWFDFPSTEIQSSVTQIVPRVAVEPLVDLQMDLFAMASNG